MIDILAQAASSSSAETIGAVVGTALLVIGGREGMAVWRTKRANGKGESAGKCPMHDQFAETLTERQKRNDQAIDGLQEDVGEIKRDVKDGFKGVFEKIDVMHGLVTRNGKKSD